MTKQIIIPILLAVLIAGTSFCVPLHSGYMSVPAMGMGGAFTAYPRDATMTIVNPALLNRTKFHFTIISIPFGLDNELTEITSFLQDNADSLGNFETQSPDGMEELRKGIEPLDDRWVNISTNPFLGVAIPGINLGATFYSNLKTGVKIDQGVIFPAVGIKGYLDTGFSIGKGFKIMDWETGLALRYYQRRSISSKRISAGDAVAMDEVISEGTKELGSSTTGISVDAGVIRTINDKLDVAVTVQDLVGVRDGWVKPNLITGVSYKLANRLLFCADINDWFNTQGVAFFQKLDWGAEYRLPFFKDWLGGFDLRAGVHQGYPTFGAGLRVFILQLDYAYFGYEAGNKPGQIMEYSHRLGITIGIN